MRKIIIRTSDRGIFKDCRLHWDWTSKMRQNIVPKGPQPAFDFGTSIHAGLEQYYDPILFTAGDLEIREASAKVAFVQSEKVFWDKVREGADVLLEQDFSERRSLGLGMLEHYFTWAPEEDACEGWKPIKTEIEFEVLLGIFSLNGEAVQIYYQGRCDVLMEDRWGNYWVWDHKTAKSFGNTTWTEMDPQGKSYVWALGKKLNLPIKGIVYNRLLKAVPSPPEELKKGGLSKNKQQRTTEPVYRQAILDNNLPIADYIEFLAFLKERGNNYFQRIQQDHNENALATLEEQIKLEAMDMIDDPRIYPNPGMFNCMGCAFISPCLAKSEGSGYQLILDQNFEVRT